MRTEPLEYLAAVHLHGSLRRASEHLHISQAGLSEAISKLERELGVTLLDRHRSGARISRAGRDLLQPVADVLESVARLRAAAGDELAARRLLRIGTVNAASAAVVLPAIRAFRQQHPGSTVEIRNLQQVEIATGLSDGTLDIGILNLFEGDDVSPELEATALLRGRPVAVLPATHRLAALGAVTADDLRGEPFIGMRSGYLMHRFAHRLFGGELPGEWHTTDGAEMGKLMVAEGIGLSLLPDYSVQGDPLERAGLLVTRPLAGDDTAVTMLVVHRRQLRLPATVRDVVGHLRRQAIEVESLSEVDGPEGARTG